MSVFILDHWPCRLTLHQYTATCRAEPNFQKLGQCLAFLGKSVIQLGLSTISQPKLKIYSSSLLQAVHQSMQSCQQGSLLPSITFEITGCSSKFGWMTAFLPSSRSFLGFLIHSCRKSKWVYFKMRKKIIGESGTCWVVLSSYAEDWAAAEQVGFLGDGVSPIL